MNTPCPQPQLPGAPTPKRPVAKTRPVGHKSSGLSALLAVALLAWLPGCGLLRAPQKVVNGVVPLSRSKQPNPLDLQLQLQRYADDFLARTSQALDEYARITGTDSAQVQVTQLKVLGGSSVISIASGPNPTANLLDMVSVTVLTRLTVEDYWIKTADGAAFRRWLEVSQTMENNIWHIAAGTLTPAQTNELHQGIRQWYAQNRDVRNAFFARPYEFGSLVRSSLEKDADRDSVFFLANLDPTAGLDPAVREVTRTRLFAERAMFTAQRMPFLLRLQAELLAHQLTSQPEVQLVLSNTTRLSDSADRISHAAESVSHSAAQLPDRISAERKEILAALDLQQGKLKDLASQVSVTFDSAEKMSTSLNTTLTTFDALMKRFGVGEPSTNTAPNTNGHPFNILEYGQVAQQVGTMAQNLHLLLTSANQSAPQVDRLSQHATAEAQKIVDHAFWRALALIALLFAGAVVSGLTYRVAVRRFAPARAASSGPIDSSLSIAYRAKPPNE